MEQQLNYQFTGVPSKLFYCLDNNCRSMLFVLLDLHNIHSNEDGWFYRSNKDLQMDSNLSENLVRVVLSTLYKAGIINVYGIKQGKTHKSNRIHINFDSFERYERYTFNDIRNNPDLKIKTLPYKDHFKVLYPLQEISEEVGEGKCERTGEKMCEKVSTILDTINTSNTIDTLNTINNININSNNTVKNKEEYTLEEYSQTLDNLCIKFINKHSEYNYLYDVGGFMNNYYDNVCRFKLYLNENLNSQFSLEDCCILILDCFKRYSTQAI